MKKIRIIGVVVFLSFVTVLKAQNTNSDIPRDTTYTVEISYNKIKKYYPEAIPVASTLPAGVEAHENLVYLHLDNTPYGERDLKLDLFRPKGEDRLLALIMIHGGGWRAGDRSMQVPMAQKIAEQGYVTLTVEYQLSLEAGYPAAIHNIKAAIRWIRANADRYNINPDQIAILGCSAGGHIASLVGMTNNINRFDLKGIWAFLDFQARFRLLSILMGY